LSYSSDYFIGAGQQVISADCYVVSTSHRVEILCSNLGNCSWRSWRTSWALAVLSEQGMFYLTDLLLLIVISDSIQRIIS